MNKEQVRDWFGNRGYPIGPIYKFKILDGWLFIQFNKSDEEVDLYYLDSRYCECFTSFNKTSEKDFDWNNLQPLVPEEEIECEY